MQHGDDREELQWLGGEAHVGSYGGRPKPAPLWQLIHGSLLLLAGVGLGSLTTVGVMKREYGKQQRQRGNFIARTSSERRVTMEQERSDAQGRRDGEIEAMGVGTILAAFGLGLLAGAAFTLLTTPESGVSVRNRLKRGMETAREELDEIVGESKEDWNTVSEDVRKAVKRTATRVKQAAEVTKEALAKDDSSVRSVQ